MAATSTAAQKPASKLFILFYALAMIGVYAALVTPVIIGMSLKLLSLNPDSAPQQLSLIVGVGAIFALIANPLFGNLSDNTTSRFGMRRPWLIGGTLVGTLGLYVIANTTHLGVIVGAWALVQLAYNAVLASGMAVLADQIPPQQRGTVSGFLGVAIGAGSLVGILMASLFSHDEFWVFMAPTLAGAVPILLFATIILKDRRLPRRERQKYDFKAFLQSFWINPFKHANFGWAWMGQFLVMLGMATLITYQTYFLIHKIGVAPSDAADKVFIGVVISTIMLIFSSIVGGMVSDKLHRRKVFVVLGALLYSVSLFFVAESSTLADFFFAVAIAGFAQGLFFAVSLALVTQVLPDKKDHAKDLGIFNIANSLPQSVAPAIAPVFLLINGPQNYTSLFMAATVFALMGAVAILPIRGVK